MEISLYRSSGDKHRRSISTKPRQITEFRMLNRPVSVFLALEADTAFLFQDPENDRTSFV